MVRPKLLLLNGFAGSGKSTVGRRYIQDHPLALLIEGDELIVNLGQWLKNEPEARQIVFELCKSLASTQLALGRDVVIPYLVTDHTHVAAFEKIAEKNGADYFNFLLFHERDAAIARLLQRGTWGEAGLDPLSEKDMPEIIKLYEQMEKQLEHQKNTIINQTNLGIEDTYAEIQKHISAVSA